MLMLMVMSGVNNMQHIDPEWAMGRIILGLGWGVQSDALFGARWRL